MLGAVSCVFLMYYLPPTSWWRFVAWLLLGLAVYFGYSYSRSEIGRKIGRPKVTPAWLMLIAVGSLLLGIGLLVVASGLTSLGVGVSTLGLLSAVAGAVWGLTADSASS